MSVMPYATVVGVFRKRAAADLAIDALTRVGFKREQMRYLVAETGAGFLDTIKSVFTGISPEEEKLVSNLTDMGLSAEEAQYFSDEYTQGSAILAIQTQGDEEMALNILAQYGAHNAKKGTSLHGWPVNTPPQAPAAEPGDYATPTQDQSDYAAPEYSARAQGQDEPEQPLTTEDHVTQDQQQEEATANAKFEVHYQPIAPTSFGFNPDAYVETTLRDQAPPPVTEFDSYAEPLSQETASNPNAPFAQEVANDLDTPLPQEALSDASSPFPQEVATDSSTPFSQEVGGDASSPFPQETVETPTGWTNEEDVPEMEGMDDMDEAGTSGYSDEQISLVEPEGVEMVEIEESATPVPQTERDVEVSSPQTDTPYEEDADPQTFEVSSPQADTSYEETQTPQTSNAYAGQSGEAPNSQLNGDDEYPDTDELQQLLTQIETSRQRLQEMRVQLEAAKEHESQLTTARLQLKELQDELQATQAELQETRLRMTR